MASKQHGVALFGIGRIGMIHLGNLLNNPRVNLLYIVEAQSERIKACENLILHKNTKFVSNQQTDEVLGDKNVTAVIICTPTDAHQSLVMQALENGNAVFCEKPIANNLEAIRLCYEKAEKLKLPLVCAFNRRFDPSFNAVWDRVQNGHVGKVHVVKTCSRDSPLPSLDYLKISNGIFHDCIVHDIDLICWILKEYPCKVYASGTAHMPEIGRLNDLDTVAVTLTFPSGALGCIDVSRHSSYGYDQRLEVFGAGGMMICGNQTDLEVTTFKGDKLGGSKEPICFSFPSRYKEAYKMELEHFIDVIEGKREVKVKASETINVCQVASACEESARSGEPQEVCYEF